MNEKVLDTLMQLFALIAKEGTVTKEEQRVIRDFLFQQLADKTARLYMDRFYAYTLEDIPYTVEQLCERVNNDLTARQKYYILIRLLELINADQNLTWTEVNSLRRVVNTFNIPGEDYDIIRNFIITDKPLELPYKNLVSIGENVKPAAGPSLHAEGFTGYLVVLHIENVDLYLLRYLGTGEVYLNGQILRVEKLYMLTPGSVIRTTKAAALYYTDVISQFWESRQMFKLNFAANNISYVFPSGHLGLHPLSLAEPGGRLVALMGASGAGKSTLLNVLNGNTKPTSGQVLINGIDIHKRGDEIRGIIGYVSQDDLLIEELTVWQNLYFNAKLCFDGLPESELQQRVGKTLDELGLLEIKHLKVGSPLNKKISGGQRKRLNIALELIREPAVLFLDEPTSGLSSRDSENVMDLLKELALRGKLVFVVIHQPSSDIFKMFDKLFVLDTGGYPIYYGNPLEGVRHFRRAMNYALAEKAECGECGNVNPEQIFNIIETPIVDEYGHPTTERKITPQGWNERYQKLAKQPAPTPVDDKPASNLRVPNKLRQAAIFLRRDVLSKIGNRSYMLLNLLEAPLLGVVLAFLLRYYSKSESNTAGYTLFGNVNLSAYILTSILVGLFIGLTVSAEEILADRRIRKREAFLHLSRHSYLVSKMILLFTLAAIQSLSYVVIGNGIIGIHELTLDYWLVLFTVTCFANVLGLNISSGFDNAVTIYILVPILLIPQIILSGALVKFDKLNPDISQTEQVPLSADFMASRWAYEALAVKQYKDNGYERHFFAQDKVMSQAQYKLNNWLPALQNKLDYVQNHLRVAEDQLQVEENVQTLDLELSAEMARFDGPPPPVLAKLRSGRYEQAVVDETQQLLNRLKKHYNNRLSQATAEKDKTLERLRDAKVDLKALRNARHNGMLSDIVRNKLETENIIEVDNRFIQLVDPIYRDPAPSTLGLGAHMYAPYKTVGTAQVDTYWYNLGMIWLMSLALYFALYFDLLRRGIEYMGRISKRLSVRK
jgi:ABC-type multidrug transport system ATPase subunit/uncharacterized tellurite resistance protein B-like protein